MAAIGEWRNWQTLLTEKAISGLVSVRYCKAPTILLYLEPSATDKGSPNVLVNFSVTAIGVMTDLQFSKFARARSSWIYLSCVSTMPS